MPIFVSRFSPERGMVGIQQRLGSRAKIREEGFTAGDRAQAAPPQAEAPTGGSVQETQAHLKLQADQPAVEAQAGGAEDQAAVDGRDGLSAVGNTGLALTLDITQADNTNGISNQAAALSIVQGDVEAIAQELQVTFVGTGAPSEEATPVVADPPATGTDANEGSGQGVAGSTEGAQGIEQTDQAREGQSAGDGTAAAPEEIPPAETQREQVKAAARAIGSGLRQDAQIQNSLNVQETSRNTSRAASRTQAQEVKQSQVEARNLQAERRKLQTEMRQTEQRIRQLQGRASSSGSASAASLNALMSGSGVNLLAL